MTSYVPQGVCAKRIDFEIDAQDKLRSVEFIGGCDGNTKGVAVLAEGRDGREVMQLLSGITCGRRGTSCPDQLAQALKQYYAVS